jgi:hypothetical protein
VGVDPNGRPLATRARPDAIAADEDSHGGDPRAAPHHQSKHRVPSAPMAKRGDADRQSAWADHRRAASGARRCRTCPCFRSSLTASCADRGHVRPRGSRWSSRDREARSRRRALRVDRFEDRVRIERAIVRHRRIEESRLARQAKRRLAQAVKGFSAPMSPATSGRGSGGDGAVRGDRAGRPPMAGRGRATGGAIVPWRLVSSPRMPWRL